MLHRGAILCYLEDTNQVREALTEVRPTFMCAVPRFYEKFILLCLIKSKSAFYSSDDFPLGDCSGTKTF